MQPERDIVARASTGGNSTSALAAYLRAACSHVWLDERVVAQGYRFYPWMSDEIPQFFNKRFTSGTTNLAITLQAGLALDGEDPFESCDSNADARAVLASGSYEPTLWVARVTVGFDTLAPGDIADPQFIARHPAEFRLVADELVALGAVQVPSCPMCSEAAADAAA